MDMKEYQNKSFSSALKDIINKEGFTRCYKSSKLYLLSRTLAIAIEFQCFETIRYIVGPSPLWMIPNALLSTGVAVSLVNPLEVLITRYALVDTTKEKLVFFQMAKAIQKR
jgi:hypothetical protein